MMRSSFSKISLSALVLSLLVPACSGTTISGVDAAHTDAARADAGPPTDAHVGHDAAGTDGGTIVVDAGSGLELDAGETTGSDAGVMPGTDAAIVDGHDAGTSVPGRFVAVGYGGHRTVSLDGRTWEHHAIDDPAGGDDPTLLRGVGYGGGVFIAVGNRVMTSVDGIEWTTTIADTGSFLSDAAWADGLWVVAGGNGLRLRSLDDGATFVDRAPGASGHFRSIAAGNGVFVAVGHTYGGAGLWSTTRDGISWTDHTGGSAFSQITFGAGVFVAVGEGGRLSVSTNGTTWDDTTLGSGLSDAAFANGELLVHGGSAYWSSTDGREWTRHGTSIPDGIVHAAGIYVGTTWSEPLLASSTLAGPWTTVDATRPAITDIAVSIP